MRKSILVGIISAFVFGLYSITNANAGFVTHDVQLHITSYFDDNGHECTQLCGFGTLEWSYDPADLLNTFQYTLNTFGEPSLDDWHSGTGWFYCSLPDCRRFNSFAEFQAYPHPLDVAFIGEFFGSQKIFDLDAITIQLAGVDIRDQISIDRFGHGEWSGQEDGQDFDATFTVPEPPALPIFILGLLATAAHGFGCRRSVRT